MMNFLKKLFGGASQPAPAQNAPSPRSKLPPVSEAQFEEFVRWYEAQQRPAIALTPDPDLPIEPIGSRLLGPAFLREGEEWPCGRDGGTLDFLAQVNLEYCTALEGYPREGIVQFFIGRDELFGADFDDLYDGNFLVRHLPADTLGALHRAPHEGEYDTSGIDDYSPAQNHAMRLRGIALTAQPIIDRIDLSVLEAEQKWRELVRNYDASAAFRRIDAIDASRPQRHHIGGFPAFTQSDIRHDPRYAAHDRVLLRLTSGDYLMWGDVGECVFMIRPDDLARGDFSRVAYSWDCC